MITKYAFKTHFGTRFVEISLYFPLCFQMLFSFFSVLYMIFQYKIKFLCNFDENKDRVLTRVVLATLSVGTECSPHDKNVNYAWIDCFSLKNEPKHTER